MGAIEKIKNTFFNQLFKNTSPRIEDASNETIDLSPRIKMHQQIVHEQFRRHKTNSTYETLEKYRH